MAREWTDALTTLHATADGRALEGIIVPYGVRTNDERRHVWAPGAFAESVDYWMARTDGARLPFRRTHGERPVGAVATLQDRADGVWGRVEMFDTAEAQDYSREVAAGVNGVSVEVGNASGAKRLRDGTVVYAKGTLHAVAGSVTPAYDGARVALHDMEDEMTDEKRETPAPPEPEPEPTPSPAVANFDRVAAERAALVPAGPIAAPVIRQTRPEFVYGPHSEYGFLSDGFRAARMGDSAAFERQERHYAMLEDLSNPHTYAGDVLSSEIPGAYPNDYVPGLLTPRIMKGRPQGSFFTRFVVNDALPKIYPKVTTSTSVAVQAAEKTNPAASDFATTLVSATPLLYGAETVVTRQVLDGSSPAAEVMILQDMIESYAQASELVIVTATEAGATASGSAITAATPYAGSVANVVKYATTRFLEAEAFFVPSLLYAVLAVQPDTGSLKPLLSWINPTNADGTINRGGISADILGASVIHSYASTVNVCQTARRDDYVIFESSLSRFSYDAVTGPAGVRIGLWAYLVVGARKGSLSVTAA